MYLGILEDIGILAKLSKGQYGYFWKTIKGHGVLNRQWTKSYMDICHTLCVEGVIRYWVYEASVPFFFVFGVFVNPSGANLICECLCNNIKLICILLALYAGDNGFHYGPREKDIVM